MGQIDQSAAESTALGFVRHLLNDVLGCEMTDVVPHAMLVEDLGADSLDMVEIQMMLEEQGVDAPDSAFHIGITAGDIADMIIAKYGTEAAALSRAGKSS